MSSPTQRSLKLLRSEGYTCQIVEKWNFFAHIRQDLFGFIDIVCLKEGEEGVLGVQTTSATHMSDHEKKIVKSPISRLWLMTGNKIELQAWSKKGKKGKRK